MLEHCPGDMCHWYGQASPAYQLGELLVAGENNPP